MTRLGWLTNSGRAIHRFGLGTDWVATTVPWFDRASALRTPDPPVERFATIGVPWAVLSTPQFVDASTDHQPTTAPRPTHAVAPTADRPPARPDSAQLPERSRTDPATVVDDRPRGSVAQPRSATTIPDGHLSSSPGASPRSAIAGDSVSPTSTRTFEHDMSGGGRRDPVSKAQHNRALGDQPQGNTGKPERVDDQHRAHGSADRSLASVASPVQMGAHDDRSASRHPPVPSFDAARVLEHQSTTPFGSAEPHASPETAASPRGALGDLVRRWTSTNTPANHQRAADVHTAGHLDRIDGAPPLHLVEQLDDERMARPDRLDVVDADDDEDAIVDLVERALDRIVRRDAERHLPDWGAL